MFLPFEDQVKKVGKRIKKMESLPTKIFGYFGEFLELKDVAPLMRLFVRRKTKDNIFFHYSKKELPRSVIGYQKY